jgi:hypothetical protein
MPGFRGSIENDDPFIATDGCARLFVLRIGHRQSLWRRRVRSAAPVDPAEKPVFDNAPGVHDSVLVIIATSFWHCRSIVATGKQSGRKCCEKNGPTKADIKPEA